MIDSIGNNVYKACVVGNMNLKHMTLMSLYTTYFDDNGIAWDVIYADEYGIEEPCSAAKVFKFDNRVSKEPTLKGKLARVRKKQAFTRFVKNILRREKYDLIVVWREETAVQLSLLLSSKYKKKYTVNIRDIDICDGKRSSVNKFFLKKCVNQALFSTVSSDGFIEHLPDSEYIFIHSANDELLGNAKVSNAKTDKSPLVITNIGTFRNDNYCFAVADAFANDERIILKFIGQGSDRIKQYAEEKKYSNIICYGSFNPKDTMDFLVDADIINCAYGADTIAEKAKMPIRFYYAIYLELPVLATEGTWIMKTANDLGIGIGVPAIFEGENFDTERILTAYNDIDKDLMHLHLIEYKKAIEDSHNLLRIKLDKFFENKT